MVSSILEVSACQRRLDVHFVHPLTLVPTAPLKVSNVEIRGGVRVPDPQVTGISWAGEVLSVEVAAPGDFSIYTLRLVASPAVGTPPPGIDPALSQIEFRFKVDCPTDFDCKPVETCAPQPAVVSLHRLSRARLRQLPPADSGSHGYFDAGMARA